MEFYFVGEILHSKNLSKDEICLIFEFVGDMKETAVEMERRLYNVYEPIKTITYRSAYRNTNHIKFCGSCNKFLVGIRRHVNSKIHYKKRKKIKNYTDDELLLKLYKEISTSTKWYPNIRGNVVIT